MSIQQTKEEDEELTERECDRRVRGAEEERNEIDRQAALPEFSFTYHDAKEFKDILQIINIVKDEPTFTINNEGLRFNDMDASHVAMIVLNCNSKAFSECSVLKDGKFSIDIDNKGRLMKDLGKVQRSKDEATNLGWSITGKVEELNVIIEKPDHRLKCRYTLLQSDLDNKPLPKLTYTVKARLESKGFSDILTNSFADADQIKFIADYVKQTLTLLDKDENGERSVTLDKSNRTVLDIEIQKDSVTYTDANEPDKNRTLKTRGTDTPSMLVGTLFLADFVKKLTKVADTLTLEYSQDKPIHISSKSAGNVEIDFWLAPRLE